MSMLPSGCFETGFNASTVFSSSSNFSNRFSIADPFSVTMFWQETTFVITANVQGFRSEDVKVEIRGRNVMLMVGGGRHNFGQQCVKTCKLPSNVNADMTTTSINNGLLLVKVPTMEHEPPANKRIPPPPPVVANVCRRRHSFFC